MAKIVQIEATNPNDRNFEPTIVEADEWHAIMSAGGCIRTVCGIQLEGDDGYHSGPERKGRVTCQMCRSILEDIQSIKGWR